MAARTQSPEERNALVHTFRTAATLRMRRARFRSKRMRRPVVAFRYRSLRAEDAFILSYPRSGSTWTLFMLSDVLTEEPTTFQELPRTVPYVGAHQHVRGILSNGGRILHSHELVPVGGRRVVYLVRDPRSVVLSEYRWQLMLGFYDGPFPAFLDDFLAGSSNPWGSWGDHVLTWFGHGQRTPDRLLIVRYEDLRREPAAHLERIMAFLGESPARSRIDKAVADNDLGTMRDMERRVRPSKYRGDLDYVGQGGITLWRDALTTDQAARIAERFAPAVGLAGYGSETSDGT